MAARKGAKGPVVELSATGLSRFNGCEVRWLWHPDEDEPELAKGRALNLGSVMHALVEARLRRIDWLPVLHELAALEGWEPGYQLPDPFDTALWLMRRHEERYPTLPQTVSTEIPFELWLPDAPVPTKVRGRMDGLVILTALELFAFDAPEECGPGLYLWETKTMSDWQRLDWLSVDPQLGTYDWATEAMGFVDVQGIVYEAIKTYHWVKDRPVHESFQRLVLPRNPGLVEKTLDTYRRAAKRAAEVLAAPSEAIPALGRDCVRCPAYGDCFPTK